MKADEGYYDGNHLCFYRPMGCLPQLVLKEGE